MPLKSWLGTFFRLKKIATSGTSVRADFGGIVQPVTGYMSFQVRFNRGIEKAQWQAWFGQTNVTHPYPNFGIIGATIK